MKLIALLACCLSFCSKQESKPELTAAISYDGTNCKVTHPDCPECIAIRLNIKHGKCNEWVDNDYVLDEGFYFLSHTYNYSIIKQTFPYTIDIGLKRWNEKWLKDLDWNDLPPLDMRNEWFWQPPPTPNIPRSKEEIVLILRDLSNVHDLTNQLWVYNDAHYKKFAPKLYNVLKSKRQGQVKLAEDKQKRAEEVTDKLRHEFTLEYPEVKQL